MSDPIEDHDQERLKSAELEVIKLRADLAQAAELQDQVRALQVELEGYRALRFQGFQGAPRFDELSEIDDRIASILRGRPDVPRGPSPIAGAVRSMARAEEIRKGAPTRARIIATVKINEEDLAQRILEKFRAEEIEE